MKSFIGGLFNLIMFCVCFILMVICFSHFTRHLDENPQIKHEIYYEINETLKYVEKKYLHVRNSIVGEKEK